MIKRTAFIAYNFGCMVDEGQADCFVRDSWLEMARSSVLESNEKRYIVGSVS